MLLFIKIKMVARRKHRKTKAQSLTRRTLKVIGKGAVVVGGLALLKVAANNHVERWLFEKALTSSTRVMRAAREHDYKIDLERLTELGLRGYSAASQFGAEAGARARNAYDMAQDSRTDLVEELEKIGMLFEGRSGAYSREYELPDVGQLQRVVGGLDELGEGMFDI
jgi:hypothetical protein